MDVAKYKTNQVENPLGLKRRDGMRFSFQQDGELKHIARDKKKKGMV